MTEYDKMSKSDLIEELRKKDKWSSSTNELMSSLDDAIIGKSLDGTITSWNRGAENIYGYSSREITGKKIMILSPPDHHDEVSRIIEKIRRGKRVEHLETVRVTKEGRLIHVSLNISPIINAAGEITGASAIARDITERKRIENVMQARLRLIGFANTHSMDELLTATLDEIEALTGSRIGFYHFLESDQKTLLLRNWSTNTLNNMCTAAGKGSHYDIDQAGVWVECVHERRPVIHNDYASLPHRKGLPEGHAPVVRELVVPIFRGNLIKAVIGVGNKSNNYNENDIETVSQLGDLSWDITERMRVEEALREKTEELDRYFTKALDLLCIADTDGYFRRLNPEWEATLGFSLTELEGQRFLDFVHPDDVEATLKAVSQLREQKEVLNFVNRYRCKSGSYRWIEWRSFPSGTRIYAVASDITDRMRMEEELRLAHEELEKRVVERTEQLEKTTAALRTSEERYALAVQGANDGIWDLNLSTGEIYFSPRWKSMLGYADEEIPNKIEEWEKRIHPDDLNTVIETRKAYLDGHIPTYENEYRLRHRDGGYRHILTRGACLRDSDGAPFRFSGSHTDITEKKLAEEALRKNEKLLRGILDNLPVGVVIYDKEGMKMLENGARRKIWGLEDVNEANSGQYKGWHADSGEKVKEEEWPVLRACREGISSSKIINIEGFDGSRKTVMLSGTPLKIGKMEDQIVGGIGVIEDITELKKLQQQLLQSQKMESIGILAGGVAHDFNNLLTAISGYGQILMESITDDDELSRESIGNILNAVDRAAELTRGLLAFSRKQLMSPQPVHIDALIKNTGKLIQRIIGEDIEFSIDLTGKDLLVKADPGQIEQVLMNLATNARDAMTHGGRLSIATTEVVVKEGTEARYDLSAPGKYAMISMADTGMGIDKDKLESIFEPFYTTKEVGKGTGLGLAIVYGIIKQHNGSILASSEPGKGTIFTIYLPLIEGQAFKEESRIPAPAFCGMETLLLAEDEEIVKAFMSKILERAGYRVIVASNGEDAVARFKEHDDISLVLSDVVMPRKNGKELLDEIRKIKPGIKVVFITGYAADVMQKKGMFEEGTEFITKPFKKDDLLRKIREVLDND